MRLEERACSCSSPAALSVLVAVEVGGGEGRGWRGGPEAAVLVVGGPAGARRRRACRSSSPARLWVGAAGRGCRPETVAERATEHVSWSERQGASVHTPSLYDMWARCFNDMWAIRCSSTFLAPCELLMNLSF